MDNLSFEKIWEDVFMFELEIYVENKYGSFKKTCYLQKDSLVEFSKMISDFLHLPSKSKEIKWGDILDNELSECVFTIFPIDSSGHIVMKVFLVQIDDDNKNESALYIQTELGLLENFGKNVLGYLENVGRKVSLN